MEKATRIIGFAGVIPLLIGSLFKIQHWPGAGLLLVLSVCLLVAVFLPMFVIHRVTKRTSTLGMVEGIMTGVTGMVVLLSMMFKIQHWPGAGALLIVGHTLLALTIGMMILRSALTNEHKQGWNMLGLVFVIAFVFFGWALNWSRNFLVAIQHNDELIQRNESMVLQSNAELRLLPAPADSSTERINQIMEQSRSMRLYISELQNLIIVGCLSPDPTVDSHPSARDVRAIDNYDVPTSILIGYDPASPRRDAYSAFTLRQKLTAYAVEMKALSENETTQNMIDSLYSFSDHVSNGFVYSWEMMHFYHASFASVMQSLNSLQLSVALTENRLLHEEVFAHHPAMN